MSDTYPIQKRIRDYRIGGDGPPQPAQAPGMEEWLRSLGSLPWMAQPGERWMYHVSYDVLGALIARASTDSPDPPKVMVDFWTLAYGAMK